VKGKKIAKEKILGDNLTKKDKWLGLQPFLYLNWLYRNTGM